MRALSAWGLSKLQSMRYVVLPQAVSLSFPSFVANVIFLLKETSVFSAISLMDLMFVTKDLMGLYYKTTECLVMLVAFYLIILVPVSVAGTYIERRLRHGSFAGLDVLFIGSNATRLLQGLWVAVQISAISVVLSIILGMLFGIFMT